MGCNCKAKQYVRTAKKIFGYASETRENIANKERVKQFFKILGVWLVALLLIPIIGIGALIYRVLTKKKDIKLMDKITIRL